MPWFKIKHSNGHIDYRFNNTEHELMLEYIQQGSWQITVTQWHPRKLDYRLLKTFYEELQSALSSGLQLNQAILHLSQASHHQNLANICKALLNQLEQGNMFNEALIKLTKASARPYCHLLNTQGSREECEKSLNMAISQLGALLDWSKRLFKAMLYPFSIIQIALFILIVNKAMHLKSLLSFLPEVGPSISVYILCSTIQFLILHSLHQGNACHWLEKYSSSYRLTKLFSLLHTTRQTGMSLQDALKNMPSYFQHAQTIEEIYSTYYMLKLGNNYEVTFPNHWFPHEAAIALHSAGKDGDIERALFLAAHTHEKHWQKNIVILEKLIPAVCLFVAGGFVTSALITLYQPLLEIS